MENVKQGKLKIIKKVFFASAWTIIAVLAVVIAAFLYSKISGKPVFSYQVFYVLTDSMEDTIPAQSYILSKSVDPSELQVGDVITFISRDPALAGNLNTHRIVGVSEGNPDAFVTRGDNAPENDPYPVKREDVVAKYQKNLSVLSTVERFFMTVGGTVAAFGAAIACIVIWCVTEYLKRRAEKDKQSEIDRLVAAEVEKLRLAAEKERAEKANSDFETVTSDKTSETIENKTENAVEKRDGTDLQN